MAWRATEILRRQPGFWQRLAGCLPDAAQRSLALSPAAAASAQDDEEAEAGEEAVKEWLRKGDTAWRLSAESSALQLLALEAFASPPGPGATHPPQQRTLSPHRPHNGLCCCKSARKWGWKCLSGADRKLGSSVTYMWQVTSGKS